MSELSKDGLWAEVFNLLQVEEQMSYAQVSNNQILMFRNVMSVQAADEFASRALALLEAKKGANDAGLVLSELASELLIKQVISPITRKFECGPELSSIITAAHLVGDPHRNYQPQFAGNTMMPLSQQQLDSASKVLVEAVSQFKATIGEVRVRKQMCSRRYKVSTKVLEERLNGRRYLGIIKMQLSLIPSNSNDDIVDALVHFRGLFLKDWSKKDVFKGVLDYIWYIAPDWSKGAAIHLNLFVDVDAGQDLHALANKISNYWVFNITSNSGTAFHNASGFNYGSKSIIDVTNSTDVRNVFLDLRFQSERERYIRFKKNGRFESFGSGSVKNGYWRSKPSYDNIHLSMQTREIGATDRGGVEEHDQDSTAKIYLGYNHNLKKPVYHRPLSLANGHILILGPSGSGKTTALLSYSQGLIRDGLPFVVLDPHNQSLSDLPINTRVISNGTHEVWGINPLHLYFGDWEKRGLDSQIDDKIEQINSCVGNTLGHREVDILKRAIKEVYAKSGLVDRRPEDDWNCPRCVNLIESLNEYLDNPDLKSSIKSIEGVLSAIRTIYGNPVFNQTSSIQAVDCLREKGLRLDLSRLEGNEQGVVMETFLRDVWQCCKDIGPLPAGGSKDINHIRLIIVIDEAHLLNMGKSPNSASRVLNTLIREGRKFGILVILATQGMNDLSEVVKKNTASWMVFRINDDAEAGAIARKFRVTKEAILGLKNASEAFFWDGQSVKADHIELSRHAETDAASIDCI